MLLLACGGKEEAKTTEAAPAVESMKVTLTSPQVQNAGLTFSKLEEKEISSILKLNGKIDVPPQNLVSISIPMGG